VKFSKTGLLRISAAISAMSLLGGCTQQLSVNESSSAKDVKSVSDVMGSYPNPGLGQSSSGSYPGGSSSGNYPGGSVTVIPNAVCAPGAVRGQSTVPNTPNVVAVLYSGVNFFADEVSVVQVWDSPAQEAAFHAQLMALAPLELPLNQSLPPGSYGVVLYDASKVQAPYSYNWQNGTEAVGPLMDDDNNQAFMDYSATFQVDSSGNIGSQQLNVVFGSEGDAACIGAGTIDPLTINLGSQAISLSSQNAGVSMDLDGNSTMQQISWFTAPSINMLLVNVSSGSPANGVIGPSQIFGNYTVGPDGQIAANGYDALAKYDSNGDGVIDSNDPIWANLRVWQDLNRNGVADAGELLPLSQVGIVSIELPQGHTAKEKCSVDSYGNVFCQGHGAYVNVQSNGASAHQPLIDIGFKPL
jgi:hypothetical protein